MSEQKSEKRKNNNDDLVDCERASRNVWLVKVPRYLSEIWEKNAGTDVGQLIQIDGDQVDFVSTTPDEPVAEQPVPSIPTSSAPINPRRPDAPFAVKPVGRKPMANISVPKKHSFKFRAMDNQSLGVLLEDKTHLREDADQRSGKLIFEGKVTTRAECRPPNSEQYMRMKMEMICKASQPNRIVKKVDRAVVTFKPKAQHAENVMKEKSKKDQGARTARAGRDAVLDMIFAAFEKHQYYKLVDLQAITKQPQNFIRDLLNDIAVYNTAPPHKNMWELKPEYRNYKPTRNVEDPAA